MKRIPGSLYAQILALEVEHHKDDPELIHIPDYLYEQLHWFIWRAWLQGDIADKVKTVFDNLLDGTYDRPADPPA